MVRGTRSHPAILIVDDDQYVRDLVAAALRRIGSRLLVAGTAAEALATAEAEPLALAIVDIGLREGDAYGYRLASELRARQAALHHGHDLRVIALTGQVPDSAAIHASGISAALMKPFSLAEFRALVAEHLSAAAADGDDVAAGRAGGSEAPRG